MNYNGNMIKIPKHTNVKKGSVKKRGKWKKDGSMKNGYTNKIGTTMIEVSLLLIIISAIAKALQDLCKINAFPPSWTWWNEKTSWRNKYHELSSGTAPRFFGSTTFLVWLTDGWHFFQMVYLNTLMLGFWLLPFGWSEWYWTLACIIGFKVVFEISYSLLKSILR